MYQALYRKYRPSTFDDVVGQQVIIQTLKNAINKNKLSHAYLFTGPRGTGKTSIAKILAKTINCENLENTTPCDKCVSCTQINQKQSSDIIEIDAASNNGVDEIRELKSKVSLIPSVSKYKVYIIDEVHMLTTGAFNALLKTLEEPPSHIIFVLATTEPHKIPSTILSRCQRFDFTRISEQDIKKQIEKIVKLEDIEIEEQAIQEIARLSDGGMRDALSLLDQVISYAAEKVTVQDVHDVNGTITNSELKYLIDSFLENNLKEILNKIDEYNSLGKNLIKLAEELINYLKNCLFFFNIPEYLKENTAEIEIYQDTCSKTTSNQILQILELFNQAITNMKNSSNPKLQLELAFLKYKNNDQKSISREIKQELILEKKKIEIKEKKKVTIDIPEQRETIDETLKQELKQLKQRRIQNTLSRFNKKTMLELVKAMDELQSYILNATYSRYASLLLDGTLKAASDDYLIFVYEEEEKSDFFNENLLIIEELIEQVFQKHYHVIATYLDDWTIIKDNFNNKKIKFEYQEEEKDLKDYFKKEEKKDELQKIFGDIVEYQ